MQITSVHNETDELTVLGAEKPVDTDGTAGSYLFNGPYEVEDGEIGCAQKYRRVYAKKSTGTATAGERWSPIIGEWTIEQDDAGPFVMAGDDLLDTNVVMVFIDGSTKENWRWAAVKAVIVTEEEKHKYPIKGKKDQYYEFRMDMATMKLFFEKDFMDALSYIEVLPE
jgi:hypothetical protein